MLLLFSNRIRLLLPMLLLAGCNSGWGPPRDVSRFESAVVADEGRLGVFTYKRRIYRPAAGWRAFPDGGPTRDLINENGIAVLDPETGDVRVLWRQDVMNSRWLPEASCSVAAVAGNRAMAICGGQRRRDYQVDSDRFWVDIATGETSPLPLQAELAARGREIGQVYLLDQAGTLALVLPLPDRPEGRRKIEPVRELLIRRSSGEYLRAGEIIHYYGFSGGEVHFWSADSRHMVYGVAQDSLRPGSYREYLALTEERLVGPSAAFGTIFEDGSWRLQWGRKAEDEWIYRTIPLTVEEVAEKGPWKRRDSYDND